MTKEKIIENYAIALFKAATNLPNRENIFDLLHKINNIVSEVDGAEILLSSPIILNRDKIKFINTILLQISAPELMINFIHLLLLKSRFNIFQDIIVFYEKLLNQAKQLKLAQVTSSAELKAEERLHIKQDLEMQIGSKLQIEFRCDPSIIGGYIVKYDNFLLDVSITGALAQIKKTIG